MTITKRGLVLGATAAAVSAVTITGAGLHLSAGQAFFSESPKELVDEVWQIIDQQYVDGTFNQVDWKTVRKEYLNRSYTSKEEAYKAIREMLKKLNDPYTRFMDPDEFRNMQIDTSGELTGVGIQLAADEKTKKLTVIAPIEDSPASKAGILAKDIISHIDDKSTEGMPVDQAVKLIRGQPGTLVKLTILRGNKQLEFNLKRARIEIHPVRYSYQKTPTGGVGYIRLIQFSQNAPQEMRNAIQKLENQQVSGYILDLRSNPGGLLYTSIDIARMWLKEGAIVSTVDRKGEQERERANNRALTDKPLVVLVDGGSASASEILSGALQDNKRAVLVGTKTFGKGLVQSVRSVDCATPSSKNCAGLAVTIAKYLTPSGRDINKHGIDPDVEVKLTDEQRKDLSTNRDKIGTTADPQYAKALDILTQQIKAQQTPRRTDSKS
ncbi:carboxyl-terminal processing protease CtpC [Leptothermofonsia sp. ETS-13]|uniref:carboxyl-terminal processing protease CtpC n=1 Tax=Leptothermofonsia sp. ETS-13 TaxID=3035696 RepID=UPI003BA28C2D